MNINSGALSKRYPSSRRRRGAPQQASRPSCQRWRQTFRVEPTCSMCEELFPPSSCQLVRGTDPRKRVSNWLSVYNPEGETNLCLGNKEVCVDERARAETAPDEEDRRSKITLVGVDHIWRDDGDDLNSVSRVVWDERDGGERTQFHSQFEAVERATPRERIGRGKTSPMTICSWISTCAIQGLCEVCLPMHLGPTWTRRRR